MLDATNGLYAGVLIFVGDHGQFLKRFFHRFDHFTTERGFITIDDFNAVNQDPVQCDKTFVVFNAMIRYHLV